MTIVPMLSVGMQFWTLCVLCGAARQYHRAKKALSFNYRATLRVGMQFWTLCVLCVALHVTQGVCDVRGIDVRLKAPFRSGGRRNGPSLARCGLLGVLPRIPRISVRTQPSLTSQSTSSVPPR
ncbi:hypothetical protein ALO88_102126 [Pseudomonas syringae pv. antirrhini]|uniref:Uncharacterized protein n=1 Tax=Pseudomonas syringae pv. antirrhini TaxID=251702 RepID=A0A0P9JPN2_9PSED|nr:hypothetical protein ALO88_102126 [Pseudomonas syringae pv. antirrhini]